MTATADRSAPPAAPMNFAPGPPWPGPAYPFVHPDRMSLLAGLHGLATPPITEARVLELGCGEGENLLALAAAWPTTLFTGVEPSAERARVCAERIAATGLPNVTLLSGTFTALAQPTSDALGTFDYIIAHGLLARLAADAREDLWRVVDKALAPNGVALVSFDSWPGQHTVEPLRRLLAFHVAEIPDDATRVQQARAMAHWHVARWFRVHGSARNLLLQRYVHELDQMSDEQVLREVLPPEHHPLLLEEFVADAARHGLQWLTNARAIEPRRGRMPEPIRELVGAFSDIVRQQQYLDFFVDTRFRTSLVCRGAHELRRDAHVDDFETLFVAPRADLVVNEDEGPRLTTNAQWLVEHLQPYVAPRRVRDAIDTALAAGFPGERTPAIGALAELFFSDALELARVPPPIPPEPPAPDAIVRATTWAVVQAQRGSPTATSVWLREVPLLELERAVLARCDGTWAHDQIVEALGPDAADALVSLHRHGLLVTGGA